MKAIMATKKKTIDLQEQQALENRWAFDLANRLMDEAGFDRSKAFKQAFLVRELLGHLGQGVVTFEYMKQDGTLRQSRGCVRQGREVGIGQYFVKTFGRVWN